MIRSEKKRHTCYLGCFFIVYAIIVISGSVSAQNEETQESSSLEAPGHDLISGNETEMNAEENKAVLIRGEDGSEVWYEPAGDGSKIYTYSNKLNEIKKDSKTMSTFVLGLFIFGLAGQIIFMGRFALQWIVSEWYKRSVVPVGFWWLSLIGASMLLTYFAIRREPVGVIGQAFGWPVYARNLWLIARTQKIEKAAAAVSESNHLEDQKKPDVDVLDHALDSKQVE